MKIDRTLQITLSCLTLACACGCANQKAWVYRSNSYSPPAFTTAKTVSVQAFEDGRENRNNNAWMLYMIPVMPCGWQTFDAPEGSPMHMTTGQWLNYKPTEDYAKALAEDLQKTGLFTDAFFDYRSTASDYAVKGKIVSTKYHGVIFSYGLSVYGPLLWVFGFPAATASNELALELSLVDSKTHKPLLSKVYTATPRKNVSFMYVMKNDFNYPEMLAEVNKQFCQEIPAVLLANSKSQ